MSAADPPLSLPARRRLPAMLAVLGLALVAACAGAIAWRYQHHQELAAARVEFIADLRASQLGAWVAERQAEARFVRTSTFMVDLYRRVGAGDVTAAGRLIERLVESLREATPERVGLADEQGRALLGHGAVPPGTPARAALEQALATGEVQITDPGAEPGSPMLLMVIPFLHSGRPPTIAAVLRVDAERSLFSVLSGPTLAGEGMVVGLWRHDASEWRWLGPATAGVAADHAPAVTGGRLAAALAAGRGRAREAEDEQGRTVIGALRPVAGSAWYVGATVARATVLRAAAQDAAWILLTGLFAALGLAAGARAWQQQLALAAAEADRRRQQQTLRHLGLYAAIAEGSADAIVAKDRGGRYLLFNDGAVRAFGVEADQVLGTDDARVLPPTLAAESRAEDLAVMADGRIRHYERDWPGRDGLRRYEVTKGPLRDADGQIAGVFAVLRDITEDRRLRGEVQRSDALRALLLQQTRDGVVVFDREGAVVEANPAFALLIGRRPDELAGLHVWDWDPLWNRERVRRTLAQAEPGHTHVDSRFRRPDGSEIDVEIDIARFEFDGRLLSMATCRDISERKRIAQELEQHRHHLEELVEARTAALEQAHAARLEGLQFTQSIADAIPSLVGYWDRDLRCRFANRAHEQWHGVPVDRLRGMALAELLGEAAMPTLQPSLQRVLAGETVQHERTLTRADGRVAHTLATLVPDRQGDEVPGFFVVVTDVSEIKQAELRLQQLNDELVVARDRAEAANRAKSAFLANMSHEMRTPMNAIVGLTHLLQRKAVDPQQRDQLAKVDAAAQHLLEVINDILDLSKIEAGKLVLDPVDFSLGALLERTVALVAERAAAKGLALEVDTDGVPDRLHGDATRLSQCLLNLLNNAVKFTDHGRVGLRCETIARDGATLTVRFEVSDTGIGIAADQRERLFQAFEQVDRSTTRRHGGTGLGLAITRRLAEALGGSVGADSEPGRGSRFWFSARLQRAAEAEAAAPAAARPADAPGLLEQRLREHHAGARVLLAEDNVVNQEVAVALLESVGLKVDVAGDGAAAIDCARRQPYDLMLLDVQMPGVDGLQAARAIRALPGAAATPILAMTANAFAEDRAACLDAGMDDHVAKPVDPRQLYGTLLRWLEPQRSAGAARREAGVRD